MTELPYPVDAERSVPALAEQRCRPRLGIVVIGLLRLVRELREQIDVDRLALRVALEQIHEQNRALDRARDTNTHLREQLRAQVKPSLDLPGRVIEKDAA